MKRIQFKNIKSKITFWLLITAILPLLIVITIIYNQRVDAINNSTFDKLTAIRDLKVQTLKLWLKERSQDMSNISEGSNFFMLENIYKKEKLEQSDISELNIYWTFLNQYVVDNPSYSLMFILDPITGKTIVSTQKNLEGNNESENTYFTEPMKTRSHFVKDIYYSKLLKRNTMAFSIPIFCRKHMGMHIVGILVGLVDLQNSLYPLLSNRTGLGETGETLIINKDGFALNELRWYDNAPLNLKINAAPALNAIQGRTGVISSHDYREEDVLGAYTYIAETGWGFVCKQDVAELNAPITVLVNNFVIIFSFVVLIIFFIAFYVSKSISNPIIELSRAANKIKDGDYSIQITSTTNDEIGSLAESTREMAISISSGNTINTGVADISSAMIGLSSIQEFGSEMLKKLMEVTGANMSTFYILNDMTSEYEHFASVGANKELLKPFNSQNPEGEFGNAIAKKGIYYLHDIPEETIFNFQTTAGNAKPKEIITIPIIVDGSVVAIISLANIHKFSKESFEVLQQSLQSINTSYSNLLANERTQILAENLQTINEQLEAQTEELMSQAEEMQRQTEELQNQSEELQSQSEELHDQNVELVLQKEIVDESSRLKSQFLTNMSHELRTPLNSVIALSRVLIDRTKGRLSEDEINYLTIIDRNGKNLLNLINDILDLSKIESGKIDLYYEDSNLYDLLYNVIDNLDQLAVDKKIQIVKNIPANITNIQTDQKKLIQVVSKVFANAIKFTSVGSVTVTATSDDKNLYVDIVDTGIGISQDKINSIFEEFYQADGTSARRYEGTGLGLAIASKIIKKLGGSIKVESELGKGSKFTIIHPIKTSDEITKFIKKQNGNGNSPLQSKNDYENPNNNGDLKGKRILLVEDNEASVIQIKHVFDNIGLIVDSVNNGQEALAYIKNVIPDGFILDIMMPEMNGIELLLKLRKLSSTKTIPVVFLTAKELTHKELSIIKENNVYQLVTKGDINKERLISIVNGMIKINGKKPNEEIIEPPVSVAEKQPISKRKNGIPKILIVEDNPDNMTTVEAVLDNKCDIIKAFDGEAGLQLSRINIPDLILMDLNIPMIDGETVMKILKMEKATSKIPIIALTSSAMEGDKKKYLLSGFDDYITKPIDPAKFITQLNKWINIS